MEIGKKYRFGLYGPITNVSVITGTLISTTVGTFLPPESNAQVHHINIYPQLPESIRKLYQDNYRSYNYFIVQDDSGNVYYIGEPWIDNGTMEELSTSVVMIELKDPDGRKIEELTKLLETNNYDVLLVSTKQEV